MVVEGGLILIPELAPLLLGDLHAEVAERSLVCADPRSTVLPSTFGRGVLAVAASSTVLDAVYAHPLELAAT